MAPSITNNGTYWHGQGKYRKQHHNISASKNDMTIRLLICLTLLLSGCTTVEWTEDRPKTVKITWLRETPVTKGANEETYSRGKHCTIRAPEPKHWTDREMGCLAHGFIHCFKGKHEKPVGC